MQRILTEEQQGATPSRVAHSGHAPETTSLWAGCQLSFVGSAGLALIRAHLESSGHLAKSNLVLQGAWQKTELPATAQTLDVLLHAPARGDGADRAVNRFKDFVNARMQRYMEQYDPQLAQKRSNVRNTVHPPNDSFFVPAVIDSAEGASSLTWSNRIVRHVLEVEPRPAASLGSSDITKIAIPHLGSHQPSNAGRLDVEVSHPNLGAILVFEVRKMWIHLDPNCPLRAGQPRQPPVAYASLFNLMLLGELNEEHPHIEMCGIANFPRIARDVLGNSHDDHGQPDFYQLFKNWVQRAFRTDPSGLNDVVLEILAWLRQESPELHKLHKDDWEKYVGLKLGDLIERQLKRIVELLR